MRRVGRLLRCGLDHELGVAGARSESVQRRREGGSVGL